MALCVVMVTYGNPSHSDSQPRVTGAVGNLLYPLLARVLPVAKSQTVRSTFDIVKAKAKLRDAGKSYADIAKPLGYERQAVGHWFRGRGEPNVQQMKIMAKELGCHWLELVTDDAMVVFQEAEIKRVQRMRNLDADGLAELDAFLAFKDAAKSPT